MPFKTATGLNTITLIPGQSLPCLHLGIDPGLEGDALLLSPSGSFDTGIIRDVMFGGACQDEDGQCIHCHRAVNKSAYKCKVEDGGCGKVWNEKCSDVNCYCQAQT